MSFAELNTLELIIWRRLISFYRKFQSALLCGIIYRNMADMTTQFDREKWSAKFEIGWNIWKIIIRQKNTMFTNKKQYDG